MPPLLQAAQVAQAHGEEPSLAKRYVAFGGQTLWFVEVKLKATDPKRHKSSIFFF